MALGAKRDCRLVPKIARLELVEAQNKLRRV
jgi:hypothetical protein